MTTLNLHHMMNPGSLAVIGASERKGSVGASIMSNLISGGFKGDIFPVNPKYKRVMGLPAVAGLDTESSEYKLEINLKDLK